MNAFEQGQAHAEMGYSIHYNPYRHDGSVEDYLQWEAGWAESA